MFLIPHFVYDFSGEMFLMLYSINGPNFIVQFPLLLEILSNMFENIITGIHLNNKKDSQKLKHSDKELK